MNPIDALKEEHRQIEMELMQLDEVMESKILNYPNLIHSFKKLCDLWDIHESEEEIIFGVMERENLKIPVEIMMCEHKDLRGHKKGIQNAIDSRDESEIRKSFGRDMNSLIYKLRDHIDKEDEVLYTIALSEFTQEELEEMSDAIRQ